MELLPSFEITEADKNEIKSHLSVHEFPDVPFTLKGKLDRALLTLAQIAADSDPPLGSAWHVNLARETLELIHAGGGVSYERK